MARREALGMSQADLVRNSGLSDLTIRRIERGEHHEYRNLPAVCRALGWTPDSITRLLRGAEPAEPAGDDVLSRLSALEQSEVATAIRLRELADAVVELTALSHRHAGRRRGEANVSSRSAV